MKNIEFNLEKNELLKNERGICFDDIIEEIGKGNILDIIQHSSRVNQKIILMKIDDYIYEVPFVESEKKYFLKTIYPSRKFNKKYKK